MGKQLAVAPHRPGPRGRSPPRERPGDGLVVVGDFQRAEILGAEIEGLLGITLAAQPTLKTGHQFCGHWRDSPLALTPAGQKRQAARSIKKTERRSADVTASGQVRRIPGCVLDPECWQEGGGSGRIRKAEVRKVPEGGSPQTILSVPRCGRSDRSRNTTRVSINPRWAGVSTSIHRYGGPVAVASQGPSLSHSG